MQELIYIYEGKFLTGGDQALLSCNNFYKHREIF